MPNDVLLQVMPGERLPIELRLAAVKSAAPYFNTRLSVRPAKAAFEMSDSELDAAVEREKHLATGHDPGHAGPVTR